MFQRCLACLPAFVLLVAPLTAAAQDKAAQPKKDQPTVIARVKSLDALFQTSRLEALKPLLQGMDLEDMIKEKVGPNGLEGFDYKRPIGIYGTIDSVDLTKTPKIVILAPITDEQKFLK